MKYYLIFLLVYLFNSNCSLASVALGNRDSIVDLTPHKNNHRVFLELYGRDDSTKALINYFFKKRKIAFLETVIPVAVGAASAIILNEIVNMPDNNTTEGNALLVLTVGLPLAVVLYAVPVYVIDGQVKYIKFSRKKLLRYITSYNAGIPLPARITKRKEFKYQLKKIK